MQIVMCKEKIYNRMLDLARLETAISLSSSQKTALCNPSEFQQIFKEKYFFYLSNSKYEDVRSNNGK